MKATALESLALAKCWAFCHFLWNHDDGKRRTLFLEALLGEFYGQLSLKRWTELWTLAEGAPDWKAIDAELKTYLSKLPK